ncbi:hypothetical protein [Bacterioplanoides sp. SCSIO 12839]|uniref:hypothetical protein n=1 Tax=Bacterioplanoides sp. SCSIO 12839 TaxID=2829569 RepID=UPI002103D334|nr:hypothetical protein [Bacterioplanoides sp. SCSIO 12839]UTW47833.1 hypothetical protein KFF03_14875 [Bacterioplanoides sp. SCSIO 12839]
MKKLIIHIGTEKTGSTTIQSFLNENRDLLLKSCDAYYPEFGNSVMGHFQLVAALHPMCNEGRRAEFAQHLDLDPDDVWDRFCESINVGDFNTVIISSEHFSSRINSVGIDFIKNKLGEKAPDFKVEIVVYLRNQVDMFQSAYSTYIKTGGTKSVFELAESIGGHGAYYNFYNLVKMWSDAFGVDSMVVKNFDLVRVEGGDLVSDFMSSLNLDFDGVDYSGEKNATWNPMFLEFVRNLNSGALSGKEYGKRLGVYEKILSSCDYFSRFDGCAVLPKEVSLRIERLFLEHNINLNLLLNGAREPFFNAWESKKESYDYDSFASDLSGLVCDLLSSE